MSRAEALALLREYTLSESLLKHSYAVEACMRAYATRFGQPEELWGITGLLHDFDYERWPNPPDHPLRGHEILTSLGYPAEMREAILGHCDYTGVARQTPLAHTLFACDELAGFLTACALVKPGKTLAEVEAGSVRRKLKDRAFARSVSRDDINKGADELGLPLDEHIEYCLTALRSIAPALGL